MRHPRSFEYGRNVTVTNLSFGGMDTGEWPSTTSMPDVSERMGPEVITARGQSLNPTSCSIQKAGHSPYLGNTIWPTLLAEVWKREHQTFKCRRIVPLYVMWCWKVPLIPCSYCLQQITELTLPLTNRSIHKSRHCS